MITFSKLDKKTIKKETLLDESDVADKIHDNIHRYLEEFGAILINELIPALKEKDIYFYYNEPVKSQHISEIREIFLSKVLSFIQPIFLEPDTPFNFLPENNQLYLVITVKDNLKDTISHVIVNIPSQRLKRFFELEPIGNVNYVIFIDDIIRENIGLIFPGQQLQSMCSIKFNRNADLKLRDEYSTHLLDKMEKQLSSRETGETSRFLYEKGMPANLRMFLSSLFKIDFSDMFEGGRYHNLSDLMKFPSFDASLHYKIPKPILYPPSSASGDIFTVMAQKDVLLHLPYHSYTPVLSFFNQAAVDPDVTEIYITLYRVAAESHIVNALISAAKNGKKVTAFIELKARFDEANNIKWSRVMKKAGVKLIYSDPSIKVHSKIALVKKKVADKIISYSILSTGNFNESTASFYTDHVLLTIDRSITKELEQLFSFLQTKNAVIQKAKVDFQELFVSRFNLLSEFEKLIDGEIKKAKKGIPALIRIKVNNLEEQYFIKLLYKASNAGVKVELIVRSVCCIVPNSKGLSENITVRRIVDKFLEHTRLFIFGVDKDAVVIMGSADLMTRNLRRRIEVCIQVKDVKCRQELLDYFAIQWKDNCKASILLSDGDQARVVPGAIQYHAQDDIFRYLEKLSL